MSFSAGLYTFLSDNLSVGERVYPLRLAQGATLPALTYQVISPLPIITHDSQQDHPLYTGRLTEETRVQFDSYGGTYDDAEALDKELQGVLTGYRGAWGDITVTSVIPALNGLDDYDADNEKYRRIADYFITWTPAA